MTVWRVFDSGWRMCLRERASRGADLHRWSDKVYSLATQDVPAAKYFLETA
jgi:hypothetical protein